MGRRRGIRGALELPGAWLRRRLRRGVPVRPEVRGVDFKYVPDELLMEIGSF